MASSSSSSLPLVGATSLAAASNTPSSSPLEDDQQQQEQPPSTCPSEHQDMHQETNERQPLLSSSGTPTNDTSGATETSSSSSSPSTPASWFASINWLLLFYFALFYAGNYGYSITNKLAVQQAMFPLTISTLNFGIGFLSYVPWLWMAHLRPWPTITKRDLLRLLPVALFTAGSHTASVYGYAHGSVSFVNIVKTAEPVFCALLSQFGGYGQPVSLGKWLTLPIIIGGVVYASQHEYHFSWAALWSACVANAIAAIRSNETKALLQTAGLQDRLQGAGNQFAVTAALGFAALLPCALIVEGPRYSELAALVRTSSTLRRHVVAASLCFYSYNELRTLTLKQTSAVTGSIANTLKRVLIVIVVALVLREHLTGPKLLGCLVAIAGVLLYSTIDTLWPPPSTRTKPPQEDPTRTTTRIPNSPSTTSSITTTATDGTFDDPMLPPPVTTKPKKE